jgi:hypothetical protein
MNSGNCRRTDTGNRERTGRKAGAEKHFPMRQHEITGITNFQFGVIFFPDQLLLSEYFPFGPAVYPDMCIFQLFQYRKRIRNKSRR